MEKEMYVYKKFNASGQLTRVAILDENKNVRSNILAILSHEPTFEVVGVYSNGYGFIKNLLHSMPDLVIVDIAAAGLKGIAVLELLKEELPQIQVLIQTRYEDDMQIYHALQAGVAGYILKSDLKDKLVQSIKEIRAGGSSMSSRVVKRVIEMVKRKDCHSEPTSVDYNLTKREKEVLACIVGGKNYKMTAIELNISYETVRSHIKRIYGKLQVASLTELVVKSINFHIV